MKLFKSYIGLLVLLTIVCGSTCRKNKPDCHPYLFLKNNSQNVISSQSGFDYPDTLVSQINIFLGYDSATRKINNGDRYSISWGQGSCFEALFSGGGSHELLMSDTLSLFVFSYDTLIKYDWETIRTQYKVLKRYDLSLKDLNQLNWTVTYPPTEVMKEMKQFPPY
ncbi:MAG: hypothetical protein ABIN48_08285 [Ginsengibacter sp.]